MHALGCGKRDVVTCLRGIVRIDADILRGQIGGEELSVISASPQRMRISLTGLARDSMRPLLVKVTADAVAAHHLIANQDTNSSGIRRRFLIFPQRPESAPNSGRRPPRRSSPTTSEPRFGPPGEPLPRFLACSTESRITWLTPSPSLTICSAKIGRPVAMPTKIVLG